jgi:hypothetical protein
MPRVYIHEVVDVDGNHRADYQHHMTANWVPDAGERRGQKCFGVFTLVGSTGPWPCVVNIWEYGSWADLAHGFEVELDGPAHRDPALAEWWQAASAYRRGGLDRILVAHDDSPSVADWEARGGTGAVAYVHEVVTTSPGEAREVADALADAGAEDHRRFGVEPAGIWRTAMRAEDEVVALWAVPDWASWARLEEAADGPGPDFMRLYERLGHRVQARTRWLLVDAELSPLRIGRQPSPEDRR